MYLKINNRNTVMTRFNTGNNIGSLSEEDFYDNCLSLDQAMNSTEPTWRDRFNVEKPTIDAALKSAGFMPAGFDFVTGGTLQPGDRNKAVYNPAPNGDNNWYRWNGVFPKEIVANSQPNPKDENNWVPVALNPETGHINVLDEGAVPDSTNGINGVDNTQAFLKAINKALAKKQTLYIPGSLGGYRLTDTVDFRELRVVADNAQFWLDHAGVGIIFGGNASNSNNKKQSFGTVLRTTGVGSRKSPDMRGIGVKGQHVSIERCEYVQLYANDTEGPNKGRDYSSAYSTLVIKKADTIDICGEENTKGWINENIFYLNRTNKILFAPGIYNHNHNKFHNGTMEGLGIIDLQCGSSNYFYGLRFERNGNIPTELLTINCAAQTWNNIIETTWMSSAGIVNGPYNPTGNQVIVNDEGFGNSVHHGQQITSFDQNIFSLGPETSFMSSLNKGETGYLSFNTDMEGVRFIKHLVNGKFKIEGSHSNLSTSDGLIDVEKGDVIVMLSDVKILRPRIYCYDNTGSLIVDGTGDDNRILLAGKVFTAERYYAIQANADRVYATIGDNVSKIKIEIGSGNDTKNLTFEYIRCYVRKQLKSYRPGFARSDKTTNRKGTLYYISETDIDLANIAAGVTCLKTDLSEMKTNILRNRYLVKSVVDNVIELYLVPVYINSAYSTYFVYTDKENNNIKVKITGIIGTKLALEGSAPSEITPNTPVDLIVTSSRVMTLPTP